MNSYNFSNLIERILLSFSFVLAAQASLAAAEVDPPSEYSRQVRRSIEGSTSFQLVDLGRPAFAIWVADSKDVILNTAAEDLARYFGERWGTRPAIVHSLKDRKTAFIVLATANTQKALSLELRQAVAEAGALAEQAFDIRNLGLSGNRRALLCLGGSPIAARYATVEILCRMEVNGLNASLSLDRLREEPYFIWRAIYINDSAHQLNNYSPNLIYDVNTYRWTLDQWKRYIDQMAFFRYNVLQIWIVPQMFSPEVFQGGGAFAYFRDTMRAVAQYARPRGIALSLINGINVSVKAGTRLDTLPIYKSLPVYTYLSPNKKEEKDLCLRLWDYWSKAIPEVGIWQLFPGDPGGCHEEGCGPETYVDLALEVSRVIKKNNPKAIIDFTPWQFFGWGPTWVTEMRKDTARVDRGYQYLMTKLDQFPSDTIFSPNLNDYTSEPAVRGGGFGGGSAARYIDQIARKHLVHTWTYFVTEGEGWINHHYKVPGIIKQRDVEARYPISGGLCYTMTPALNLLNQFACAETFWNPSLTEAEIMKHYTEGIFGSSEQKVAAIFPNFDVAPMVGYTFADAPNWQPDFHKILSQLRESRNVLQSLDSQKQPRFVLLASKKDYIKELLYFCELYEQVSLLGREVSRARTLVHQLPAFKQRKIEEIRLSDARAALSISGPETRSELESLLNMIERRDVAAMKTRFQAKHYQIFLDYPTEFTPLLPKLVNGFFNSFGADFLDTPVPERQR